MASIGLRINNGGDAGASLSLADTLAKGIFGDPEAAAKAAGIAAQIRAHDAYVARQAADTGLVNVKTKEEQAQADAIDAAVKVGPTALNAAVPQPGIVEAPHPSSFGGYGPQPGIVDPVASKMHDAQIAQNNALWPVILRAGGNPTQLIEAAGKGEGLSALSGGLVPGSRPDPNVQRVAGGLYTGSAPSTSTVWSPGDTAGQDAEARRQIQVDAAKPQDPNVKAFNNVPYIIHPDGSVTPSPGFSAAPAKQEIVDLRNGGKGAVTRDTQGNIISITPIAGAAPAPDKQEIIDLPTGGKATITRDAQGNIASVTPLAGAGPKQEIIDLPGGGKGGLTRDSQGNVVSAAPIAGAEPRPEKPNTVTIGKDVYLVGAPDESGVPVLHKLSGGPEATTRTSPYADSTAVAGIDNATINTVATKIIGKQPVTPQEAIDYDQAWQNLYTEHTEIQVIDGVKREVTVPAGRPPSRAPTPDQVYAQAGMAPPPPQAPPQTPPPVQAPVDGAPQQAPVQAPAGGGGGAPGGVKIGKVLETPQTKPLTVEQEKSRTYAVLGHDSNDVLTAMNPKSVPSGLDIALAQTGGSPGPINSLIGSFASPEARKYARAATQFIEAYARPATGATISPEDYQNFYQAMIPLPNDEQGDLDAKAKTRADLVGVWESGGFPDDASRDAFLASRTKALKSKTNTPLETPPASYKGTAKGWSHMSPEDRKLFQ